MALFVNSFESFQPAPLHYDSSESLSIYTEIVASVKRLNSSKSSLHTSTVIPSLVMAHLQSPPTVLPGLNESNSVAKSITETVSSPDPTAYFGDVFMSFNYSYRQVHGSASLAVCVFGIIANVLNIIVLTRKNMISPTNLILSAMAVSDLLVIASYIPFVIHNFMRPQVPLEEMYAYGWAVFTLLHAHNTVVFHTISIWLTVLLAVWRYLTVRSPQAHKSFISSMTRAKIAIVLTYCAVPVFCIPIFICFTIYPFYDVHHKNVTLYKVDIIQMDGKHEILLEKINFWVFSVLLKLIPCILLTCLSLALVRILIDARKRKERLLGANFGRNNSSANEESNHFTKHKHHSGQRSFVPNRSSNQFVARPSIQPGPNQLYLEIAGDNSPTECDHSSKSSKGSHQQHSESTRLQSFLGGCVKLAQCAQCVNTLDRCTWCCGYLCCCIGAGIASCISGSSSHREVKLKLKPTTVVTSTPVSNHHNRHRHHHHHPSHHSSSGNSERTTRMLIAVLIMFLICEFPSGILALLSAILGKLFFSNVYNNFGELMDMLALINSAVNFVLYCLMSQQFRKTFSQLFCIRWTEEVTSKSDGSIVAIRKGTLGRLETTVVTEMIGTSNEESRTKTKGSSSRDNEMTTCTNGNSKKISITSCHWEDTVQSTTSSGRSSGQQTNNEMIEMTPPSRAHHQTPCPTQVASSSSAPKFITDQSRLTTTVSTYECNKAINITNNPQVQHKSNSIVCLFALCQTHNLITDNNNQEVAYL